MQNELQRRCEKLLVDAVECDLLAKLSTEKDEKRVFHNLSGHYHNLAKVIRTMIAERAAPTLLSRR